MRKHPDIYSGDRLSSARTAIRKRLPPEEAKLLEDVGEVLLARGRSRARVAKVFYMLLIARRFLGKPFLSASRKDIEGLCARLNSSRECTDATQADVKTAVKTFYTHLHDGESPPPEVAWIKTKAGMQLNGRLPEDMPTPEEVDSMRKAADNDRDRAIIALLYETGCRVGEILSMRLKVLKRAAKAASIQKRVNPHNFRHSSATHRSPGLQASTRASPMSFLTQPLHKK